MWFKNLQLYHLSKPFELSAEELHEQLLERASRECGTLEMSVLGWHPPLGRHGSQLTHGVGQCIMICIRKEEKVIPSSVVRDLLDEKVAFIEEQEGRKVRRREKEELKDELMTDLLPRAFIKSSLTYAYIDTQDHWLVVDATSPARAEELISLLRETLGSLPLKPLEVAVSPAAVMTSWLSGVVPPSDYQVQDECELRDPVEEGAIVRCRRQNLEGEEIHAHLEAGKQVVRLAVEWNERLAFVMADDLSVKRLKFLDVVQEEAAEAEAEDAATRFDVDFALMSLELRACIARLVETYGGQAEAE